MGSPDVPSIVILTGAGISAESGIPTFRGADGLWEGHRIEDVASPEGFQRNPELVQHFYNLRRAALALVEPNDAHRAIARLQQNYSGYVTLITQNVDDLHERGGSPAGSVQHMHGELKKARCLSCGIVTPRLDDLTAQTRCPACQKMGTLRPHIVWFGEMPLDLDELFEAVERAGIFVAIGTSGQVYPAASFVDVADATGAKTIEFNLESTAASSRFHEQRFGPASREVSRWVEEILHRNG